MTEKQEFDKEKHMKYLAGENDISSSWGIPLEAVNSLDGKTLRQELDDQPTPRGCGLYRLPNGRLAYGRWVVSWEDDPIPPRPSGMDKGGWVGPWVTGVHFFGGVFWAWWIWDENKI